MTNEIKEKLDNLRIYAGREESGFICDIENYITNLQEIEKEHQKINGELRQEINDLQEENEKLEKRNKEIYEGFMATTQELCEYAEKIDKATNYILKNICCDTRVYTKSKNVYKVVDILRGDE